MTEEKNADTGQIILDSAERLFLEKGFARTSTTEIAKEAGCNQSLVHYYYRTKERLFEAIFELKLKLFLGNFLKIGNDDIPFEEKLKRKIEAHYDILAANPRLPFLVLNELTSDTNRITSLKKKVGTYAKVALKQFEDELAIAIAKGTIRNITPLDLILTIISMNVALFLASPIIRELMDIDDKAFDVLVARRKQENVAIILKGIKP